MSSRILSLFVISAGDTAADAFPLDVKAFKTVDHLKDPRPYQEPTHSALNRPSPTPTLRVSIPIPSIRDFDAFLIRRIS
ncbi:hypothetical protein EC957_001255 [Mortierella hygrophila]|uniref:Uncharacterized protein n=1 Tax=Mortierella hygrophila TaxID=979708 RepID=A0A9P6F5T8_9FUNG|nr:hypothetical protein EC957_001255 [Mortierella hygrophila]